MASLIDDLRTFARGWRWGHRPLVPHSAEPWAPRQERPEFPTEWARTPAAEAIREGIQRYLLKPVVWNEMRVSVEGLDRLEGIRGPMVFASTHASHVDTPLVLCSLPRRFRRRTAVGAAADYFFDAWWRATATALAFNTFPIDRSGGRRTTETAERLLADGWNLLVFPEGTRSADGWVKRFRRGVGMLCVDHGVPAVPVALRGTHDAMPRGRSWPRPGRPSVSIRYGTPLHPEPGEGARHFTDRVQDAVARLLDEDRTSWWESIRREAEETTPSPAGPPAARWRRAWEGSRPLPHTNRPRIWR